MTAPVTEPSTGPRPQGRPRDPQCDVAIVGATLELLAEGGYGALTMEAVASRAGVGKATLYRRFPGKEQLVIDAVATLTEAPEPDREMGVREELVAMLEALRRKTDSLAGKIFPRLVGESADNPELMQRYRERVLLPRRQRFAAVLQRGVEEGLLRADLDVEHAIDLLIGPMAYRNMLSPASSGGDAPPGPDLARRIVDDVLAGLLPREGS